MVIRLNKLFSANIKKKQQNKNLDNSDDNADVFFNFVLVLLVKYFTFSLERT